MNYGRRQYLRYCFNMHVKDMWLWSTRKHGSGHRRFLEGVFLKCSLRGCIMKTEPSHSSPSSPFSTSFYINLDPPWEHRLKMVEESIHRTSCSSSQTFPSFRFIRRMTVYILDISGWCRWLKMGADTHSNRFQCLPMCLFNICSIGCSMDMFGSQKKHLHS